MLPSQESFNFAQPSPGLGQAKDPNRVNHVHNINLSSHNQMILQPGIRNMVTILQPNMIIFPVIPKCPYSMS